MKNFYLLIVVLLLSLKGLATGEPSTYFNIFVPPNNDAVQRNACLIVTAIYDSTYVTIQDDGADGDTDDNWSGYLNAGQSYILYIKDNGINDDALYASGGVLKRDGDYFIIQSNALVLASQATNSDWQHDWVPSVNKSSLGTKFIIYSPLITSSNRDLNVFAYSDSTSVTIRKISNSANGNISTTTNVDYYSQQIVVQKIIHRGQDLIYFYQDCRNLMLPGHTYVVETSKPVTVQYGALWGNARDGGGYVPSSNGSSAGELFYFGVPYDAPLEQEIRIVSWDDANEVILERYSAGSWVLVKNWTLGKNKPTDWVGKQYNATYATTFRVRCSSGKKVSVFEANWLETGSIGTSDIATMVSSSNGTSSGNNFLIYLAPPGKQNNVINPATNQVYGGNFTHLYFFAKENVTVNVKDAKTDGLKINRTYQIAAGRYIDCYFSVLEWKSIYNGTGTAAGGTERPYVTVTSDKSISVMATNFNDNWMMYFGSSLKQAFTQSSNSSQSAGKPGDVVKVESQINISGGIIVNPSLEVEVSTGGIPINAVFRNNTDNDSIVGNIIITEDKSKVSFEQLPDLDASKNYTVETTIEIQVNNNNGTLIPNNTVINVDNKLTGMINGEIQQSVTTTGIQNQTALTSNLIFSRILNSPVTVPLNNTWTANWIDYDNDNDDDLYVPSYLSNTKGTLYRNDNSVFVKVSTDALSKTAVGSIAAAFGDVDNDGNLDCVLPVNTGGYIKNYEGNGANGFQSASNAIPAPNYGYQHGAAFADYDNDGYIDVFVSLFMPTEFNQLYHNKGDGTFELVQNAPMSLDKGRCIGASWADFDNDGDQDLFVPNGNGGISYLYINQGGGNFIKNTNLINTTNINAVASCWADYDNDRDLDLFISNATKGANMLYKNNGNGGFTLVTNNPIVTEKYNSHGCSFADIDNDGDLDAYVSNDNDLFINDGQGNFSLKTNEVVCAKNDNSYGHSWSDYDKDGDLDLFVATKGNSQDLFFSNNGNANKYFKIKLEGTQSNHNAIGARIEIKTANGWQIREINSQSGLGGNSSYVQHFGCGNASVVDSIIIKWPSGYRQILKQLPTNTTHMVKEDNGVLVNVYTYLDVNGNCTKDANEAGVKGSKFSLGNGIQGISDQNGLFQIRLKNGNYSIKQEETAAYLSLNNCGGVSNGVYSLAVNGTPHDTVNVYFTNISTSVGYDLQVNAGHSALRRGFINDLHINYSNKGTIAPIDPIVVSVEFPNGIIPKNATPMWDRMNGNVCEWDIAALGFGEYGSILINDSTSLALPIDSNVDFIVSIDPKNGDLNNADNSLMLRETIKGAIDPNDMLVSPIGVGSAHLVNLDQALTYTVRFQNVGNYACHTVKIENEISPDLDMSTLRFINTSHDAQISISGRKITWLFKGIELPDSASNEAASHGFINYSILGNKTIKREEIINNASIYFDFEAPIVTNNCRTTLVGDEAESILLFPNPASQEFVTVFSLNPILDFQLVNTMGQSVDIASETLNGGLQLHTENLSVGVYQIIIQTASGRKTIKFVMK